MQDTPLPPVEFQPYRLQVGDLISVVFWGNPDLNQDVTIRPDGQISLPFVDEVQAAGLTPAQLDDELTGRYTGELARPEITIIVRDVPSNRVFVGGEVAQPGAYALVGTVTLAQVVHEAGGFLSSARRGEILLIRTEPTGERFARSVDLLPVLSGKNPAADVSLKPFDVVFVPRTKITNFGLFVDQYVNQIVPDWFFINVPVYDEPLIRSGEN